MKTFTQFINENSDMANWWERNLSNMRFDSQEEALSWIKRRIDKINKDQGHIFGNIKYDTVLNLLDIKPIGKKFLVKAKAEYKPKPVHKKLEYLTNFELIRKQKSIWTDYYGHEFGKNFYKVQWIDIKHLHPTEKTDEFKVTAIKNAIKNGEELPPILIDNTGNIMDGHHRYEAAKQLRIKEVPVLVFDESNFILEEKDMKSFKELFLEAIATSVVSLSNSLMRVFKNPTVKELQQVAKNRIVHGILVDRNTFFAYEEGIELKAVANKIDVKPGTVLWISIKIADLNFAEVVVAPFNNSKWNDVDVVAIVKRNEYLLKTFGNHIAVTLPSSWKQ